MGVYCYQTESTEEHNSKQTSHLYGAVEEVGGKGWAGTAHSKVKLPRWTQCTSIRRKWSRRSQECSTNSRLSTLKEMWGKINKHSHTQLCSAFHSLNLLGQLWTHNKLETKLSSTEKRSIAHYQNKTNPYSQETAPKSDNCSIWDFRSA